MGAAFLEGSLNLSLCVDFSAIDSGTESAFPLPLFFGTHRALPEWIRPALHGPVLVDGTPLVPEDAIVVWFLPKTQNKALSQVDPSTKPFDKDRGLQAHTCGKDTQVLSGEKDVPRIVPATGMTLGAFEFNALVIEGR
jgi:hypothetical protein